MYSLITIHSLVLAYLLEAVLEAVNIKIKSLRAKFRKTKQIMKEVQRTIILTNFDWTEIEAIAKVNVLIL